MSGDDTELPEGWAATALGEVATTQLGKTIDPKEKHGPCQRPYLRNANVQWDAFGLADVATMHFGEEESRRYRLEAGDLLICEGGVVGRGAIWTGAIDDCHFQNALHRIRPRSERVTNAWLLENIRWLALDGKLAERARGNTILHLSQQELRSLPVVLPPREVQDAVLATVSAARRSQKSANNHLDAARRAIHRVRRAVLAVACTGRLTADWRADAGVEPARRAIDRKRAADRERFGKRRREPTLPDPRELPDLPEEWCWATLPELGELGRGKSKLRPRNDPRLYGGDYPFIQTGDVARSGGRIRSHSQTYNEAGLAQSRLWPERTVCITIAANIAESALLTYPACFPDSVVGLMADESVALPEYVEFFVRTAQRELQAFAPATAQANINLAILSELAVPIPPIEEQTEIVRRTSAMLELADGLVARIDAATRRTDRSSQAVLAKAFRGELIPPNRPAALAER